jgi:hypothetical protein
LVGFEFSRGRIGPFGSKIVIEGLRGEQSIAAHSTWGLYSVLSEIPLTISIFVVCRPCEDRASIE